MQLFSYVLVSLGPVLALAFPFLQTPDPNEQAQGFSVEFSRHPSKKRDFVKEWTATRMKWGGAGAVPEGVHSTFQLGDAGKIPLQQCQLTLLALC
jgi:hypothetical protein